jgi:hypothetical protein
MDLYSQIIEVYPELAITEQNDPFFKGIVKLQDDGDGVQYIAEWNYSKPIPDGLKLGK